MFEVRINACNDVGDLWLWHRLTNFNGARTLFAVVQTSDCNRISDLCAVALTLSQSAAVKAVKNVDRIHFLKPVLRNRMTQSTL